MFNKENNENQILKDENIKLKKELNKVKQEQNRLLGREKNFKEQIYVLKEQRNNLNQKLTKYSEVINHKNESLNTLKFQRDLQIKNFQNEIRTLKDKILKNKVTKKPNYDEVTFILPFHNGDKDREENLLIVLNYLCSIGVKDVIISELDTEKKVSYLEEKYSDKFNSFKYIFTKHDGMFNKSKSINIGIKNTKKEHIIIHDCDVLLPKKQYDQALSFIYEYDVIFFFDRKIKQITDKKEFVDNNFDFSKVKNPVMFSVGADGGLIEINRKSVESIGLFNENFNGYGYEDQEFVLRTDIFNLDVIRLPYTIYHLYHSHSKSIDNKLENFKKLKKIYALGENDPQKVIEEINYNL